MSQCQLSIGSVNSSLDWKEIEFESSKSLTLAAIEDDESDRAQRNGSRSIAELSHCAISLPRILTCDMR